MRRADSSGSGEGRLQYSASIPRPFSAVVLPFASFSADPEQGYLADAITDNLTTDLSRIADSFVISRTTASTYKGKAVDARQIARDLGVHYVLEGSVRRLGERIQVNIQVIEGETGSHVWADRFDTDHRDMSEAQTEIVGRLASTLNRELVRDISRRAAHNRVLDSSAHDLVMRARALTIQHFSSDAHRQAIELLEQALAKDPGCLDAKIQIGLWLTTDIADGVSGSVAQDLVRAERLILDALDCDPDNPSARGVLASLRRIQGRWAESQVEWETVIACHPNDTRAIRQLGQVLMIVGQPEAAIPHLEKAIRLDPRANNAFVAYVNLANCHLFLGHIHEGVSFYRKARALHPGIWYVHLYLAGALALTGELDEAKREIADGLHLKPDAKSITHLRAIAVTQGFGSSQLNAMREKTTYAGLRRVGFPEE